MVTATKQRYRALGGSAAINRGDGLCWNDSGGSGSRHWTLFRNCARIVRRSARQKLMIRISNNNINSLENSRYGHGVRLSKQSCIGQCGPCSPMPCRAGGLGLESNLKSSGRERLALGEVQPFPTKRGNSIYAFLHGSGYGSTDGFVGWAAGVVKGPCGEFRAEFLCAFDAGGGARFVCVCG